MSVHGTARGLQEDVRADGRCRSLRGVAQDRAFDYRLLVCVIGEAARRRWPRPDSQLLRPNVLPESSKSAERKPAVLMRFVLRIQTPREGFTTANPSLCKECRACRV